MNHLIPGGLEAVPKLRHGGKASREAWRERWIHKWAKGGEKGTGQREEGSGWRSRRAEGKEEQLWHFANA